jgi:hypothetical protein
MYLTQLIVISICIFLRINDVEHLCKKGFVFHLSSFAKCLFKWVTHFLNLYWFLKVLYIPDTSPFLDISLEIFLLVYSLPFPFLDEMSFEITIACSCENQYREILGNFLQFPSMLTLWKTIGQYCNQETDIDITSHLPQIAHLMNLLCMCAYVVLCNFISVGLCIHHHRQNVEHIDLMLPSENPHHPSVFLFPEMTHTLATTNVVSSSICLSFKNVIQMESQYMIFGEFFPFSIILLRSI